MKICPKFVGLVLAAAVFAPVRGASFADGPVDKTEACIKKARDAYNRSSRVYAEYLKMCARIAACDAANE